MKIDDVRRQLLRIDWLSGRSAVFMSDAEKPA
jgi:hypothetical protein